MIRVIAKNIRGRGILRLKHSVLSLLLCFPSLDIPGSHVYIESGKEAGFFAKFGCIYISLVDVTKNI